MPVMVQSTQPKSKRWTYIPIAAVLIFAVGAYLWFTTFQPWLYGIEAYVYGFPLIMMDLTKEVSTAVPTAGEFTGRVGRGNFTPSLPQNRT
jgi:hypothetical protein